MLHDAPVAFQFPVSPSVRAGIFIGAICTVVALAIAAWSWPLWPTGFVWQRMLSLSAALLWLLANILAFKQWRHAPSGRLLWLGHAWAWQGRLQPQQRLGVSALDCVWDGQSFLLLRVQWRQQQALAQAQRPRMQWLWLDRSMAPALWGDMRRAMLHWQQRSQR